MDYILPRFRVANINGTTFYIKYKLGSKLLQFSVVVL